MPSLVADPPPIARLSRWLHRLAANQRGYYAAQMIDWLSRQPSTATAQDLWNTCPNGAWLMWFAVVVRVPHASRIAAIMAVARTYRRSYPAMEWALAAAERAGTADGPDQPRWRLGLDEHADWLVTRGHDLAVAEAMMWEMMDIGGTGAAESMVLQTLHAVVGHPLFAVAVPACAYDAVADREYGLGDPELDGIAYPQVADAIRREIPWHVVEMALRRFGGQPTSFMNTSSNH